MDHQNISARARTVVTNVQLEAQDANPIFTQEMFDLLQEQNPHSEDPLCLFRYQATARGCEWYVYGAQRMGSRAMKHADGRERGRTGAVLRLRLPRRS